MDIYDGWVITCRYIPDLYQNMWSAIKVDRSRGMSGYLTREDLIEAIDRIAGRI